jgi:tetratricopeptide (TPR) repeat protein
LCIGVIATLVVQSGIVRYQLWAGAWELSRATAGDVSTESYLAGGQAAAESLSSAGTNRHLSEAIAHFQNASRWGLFRPRTLSLQLAALQLQAGSPIEARKELNELLAADPSDSEGRLLEARAWLADGNAAIGRRHLDSIVAASDASTAKARRTLAAAYSLLGNLSVGEGDSNEALRQFDQALKYDPARAEALLGRAAVLGAQGSFAEAAKCFMEVLNSSPNSAEAHNNLAAMLVHLDRRDEALAHYQQAAELDPKSTMALTNAGQLLLDAGRLDEAERKFQQALQRRPNDAAAQAGLSETRRVRASNGGSQVTEQLEGPKPPFSQGKSQKDLINSGRGD